MSQNEDPARFFVAIDVPQTLRDQVRTLPHSNLDFLRRLHLGDLHMTLRFIGNIPVAALSGVHECLLDLRKIPPFDIEVAGLDIFTRKNHVVLFAPVVSVKKPAFLADTITKKLQDFGFTFEPRPYQPHVTIARLRNDRNTEKYIAAHRKNLRDRWRAEKFHLMKSADVGEGERRYTIIESYNLSSF